MLIRNIHENNVDRIASKLTVWSCTWVFAFSVYTMHTREKKVRGNFRLGVSSEIAFKRRFNVTKTTLKIKWICTCYDVKQKQNVSFTTII